MRVQARWNVAIALSLLSSAGLILGATNTLDECWEAKVGSMEHSTFSPGYSRMKFDSEGNLYVWTNSYQGCCFRFVKLNHQLQLDWEIVRTPEPGYATLTLVDCAIDPNGRVLLTGWTATNSAPPAVRETLVLGYDRNGTALWTNRYPSAGLPHGIGSDAHGNVYVVSTTSEGQNQPSGFIELIKMNSIGERIWAALYDGPSHQSVTISSVATGPGGLVCFGLGPGADASQTRIVAYGDDGTWRWTASTPPYVVIALSLVIDSAGDIIVEAQHTSPGGSPYDSIWLAKLGASGQVKWISLLFYTAYGGSRGVLHLDEHNNVYCAAVDVFGTGGELGAAKLDPEGRPLWWIRFNDRQRGDPSFYIAGAITTDGAGMVRIASAQNTPDLQLSVAQVIQNATPGRPVMRGQLPWRDVERVESLGSSIELNSFISGSEPVTFQWRHNGVDIPGATNASLFIANAATTDGGTYCQIASNPFGCSRSPELTLRLYTPPAPQLMDIKATEGQLAFTIVGFTNIQYQVETSSDLRRWAWCCSRQAGRVSIDKPAGNSTFVRVGVFVPPTK